MIGLIPDLFSFTKIIFWLVRNTVKSFADLASIASGPLLRPLIAFSCGGGGRGGGGGHFYLLSGRPVFIFLFFTFVITNLWPNAPQLHKTFLYNNFSPTDICRRLCLGVPIR